MSIIEPLEDLRLDLGLRQRLVSRFVASIVIAIGIDIRSENNVLAVRRPQQPFGFGGDAGQSLGLDGERAIRGEEILKPYLKSDPPLMGA